MGLFETLANWNPFSSRIVVPEPDVDLDVLAASAEREMLASLYPGLSVEAARRAEREMLAIPPPIDVRKTPRRPGHYEEPRELPYFGSSFNRPIQCMTNWNPQLARQAIDASDAGNFGLSALWMEEMLRDDAVSHGYKTRSGRLFGLPPRVVPAQRDGRPRRGAERAARLWRKYQRLIFPMGCKKEIMKYLYFKNFSICSIAWLNVPNDGEIEGPPYWRIPQFKPWHPYFIIFVPSMDDQDGGAGGQQANGHYQIITYNEGTVDLIGENAPGRGRWVIFQGAGMRPWLDGLDRPLTSPTMRRMYTRRDHARFEERHGLPIMKVKYPTYFGGENKEWQAFDRSLRTLGSEGLLMCPRDKDKPEAGVDVDFVGPPNAAAVTSFVESKKEEDRDIYTLWLGQSLTTEAGQDGGSHAAVLGMERRIDDKAREDAFLISDAEIEWYTTKNGEMRWRMMPGDGAIREQVGRFFSYYNFGDPDLAPHDMIDGTPQEDRRAAAELAKDVNQANLYKAQTLMAVGKVIEQFEKASQEIDAQFVLEQMNIYLKRPDEEEDANPGLSSVLAGIAKDGNFEEIDFRPAKGVRLACARAVRWIVEGYNAPISALGQVQALLLSKGKPWTPQALAAAHAWFAANPTTPAGMEGRLLWDAHGGDAGRAQVVELYQRMQQADARTTRLLSALTEEDGR